MVYELAAVSLPSWLWIVSTVVVIGGTYWVLSAKQQTAPIDELAQVILKQNNMQSYWKVPGVVSYDIPVEGGVIHKINGAQAQTQSTWIQRLVPREVWGIICGLFASESVMDPLCVNENLNGSKPSGDQ